MILQRWQPGMDLIKADPSSIPIWINFHNVPLALWHTDCFAFLASHFGKPLYLADLTLKGNKLAFARVCVDIEATTIVPYGFKSRIVRLMKSGWKSLGSLANACIVKLMATLLLHVHHCLGKR